MLLLSVPYALKAGDAATVGGLPPSAFVLAAPLSGTGSGSGIEPTTVQGAPPPSGDITGTGTVDYLPLWDSTSDIISSVLYQKGTGKTAKIGINTITPASTLDVKGGGTVRGTLSLPSNGTATATAGKNSQPLNLAASAFNSTSSTAVNQTFQWQSEPVGNNTSTPSGTLNLLFGEGATKPSETGLNIASNGQIKFATGQTFPGTGTGDGTVTSVATGLGLKGGPITTSGTLTIDTTVVPQLNTANTFTGNQTVNGSVTATSFSGSGSAITNVNASQLGGLAPSAYAQLAAANTFSANQTVNGSVTATSFTGNGSGLTNVTAANSNELGGLSSSAYAQLAAANSFTANQTVAGVVLAGASSSSTAGVLGEANASSGQTYGVAGLVSSPSGYGVEGYNAAGSGAAVGIYGISLSPAGYGVVGADGALPGLSTEGNVGVYGSSIGSSQKGADDCCAGVWGDTAGAGSVGVLGTADNSVGGDFQNNSYNFPALYAINWTTTAGAEAFDAAMPGLQTDGETAIIGDPECGAGYMALQLGQSNRMSGCSNYTLLGNLAGSTFVNANSGQTVHLRVGNGDQLTATTGAVNVNGTFTAGDKKFKIDHPLDPANKYLYHTSVESSEMMNIYTGNVTTGGDGLATVQLPDWFEALNKDFRYQLTVIGQFAQAIVASEISHHHFSIRTDKPNVKVSWQVTGVRHDAYAIANQIPVEVEKAAADRGHYLYPEALGQPTSARIGYEAPPPASEHVTQNRPVLPRRGNAQPMQGRPPLNLPVPPPPSLQKPAPPRPSPPQPPTPRLAPLPHPAALANKLEVNQE